MMDESLKSEEKVHDLIDEPISSPQEDAINSEETHDSPEASNGEESKDEQSATPPQSPGSMAQASLQLSSETEAAEPEIPIDPFTTAGDMPTQSSSGVVVEKSTSGWVSKANCCDDLNRKMFADPNDVDDLNEMSKDRESKRHIRKSHRN